MKSLFLLSNVTSTFNSSNWIKYETIFFQRQDEKLDFVACAEKCHEKHATLPCVENYSMNDWLFDQYGDDRYWIGLFQSPGTTNSKDNWKNWQREECDSSYRNWNTRGRTDFLGQEACAISGFNGVNNWFDDQCNLPRSCICQYVDNLTDNASFFDNDAISLLEESGKYIIRWDDVLFMILLAISVSITLPLLLYNIKLVKRQRGTKNFVSKRTLISVLFGLVASLLISFYEILYQIITQTYDLPISIFLLFVFLEITLFLLDLLVAFVIALTTMFNLLDAAALATGGVRETRKGWVQFLRLFNIILPVLSLLFASFVVALSLGIVKLSGFDRESGITAYCLTFSLPYIALSVCGFVVYLKIHKLKQSHEMKKQVYMLRMSITQRNTNKMHRGYIGVKNLSKSVGIILLLMGFGFIILAFLPVSLIVQVLPFIVRIYRLCGLLIYFGILRYTANIVNSLEKRDQNQKKNQRAKITATSHSNDRAIYNTNGKEIGRAPPAPKPDIFDFTPWIGQTDIQPINWSISLEHLMQFLRLCMATKTWEVLVAIKGEDNICMHDINAHFVIPWTKGTGCSIALLFDQAPGEVELMFSHSWSASVIQTYNALSSLPLMHMVPMETRVFFCTLCQYQAGDEDGDDEEDVRTRRKFLVRKQSSIGLSIREQLDMDPFSCIINNEPKFGMFVLHTLISEVYTRLWCVYEVNEGLHANIGMTGLFDPTVWTLAAFKKVMKVNTEEAECHENDRDDLVRKIEVQGGFRRLDKTILRFRKEAFRDLKNALKMEFLLGVQVVGNDDNNDIEEDKSFQLR